MRLPSAPCTSKDAAQVVADADARVAEARAAGSLAAARDAADKAERFGPAMDEAYGRATTAAAVTLFDAIHQQTRSKMGQ